MVSKNEKKEQRKKRKALLMQQAALYDAHCVRCPKKETKLCKACPLAETFAHIGQQIEAIGRPKEATTELNELVAEAKRSGLTPALYEKMAVYALDKHIARELGVSVNAFQRWKAVCISHAARYTKISKELFFELYEQGYTAKKIAGIMGVTPRELSDWRRVHNITTTDIAHLPRYRAYKRYDRWQEVFGGDNAAYLKWVMHERKQFLRALNDGSFSRRGSTNFSQFDLYLRKNVFTQQTTSPKRKRVQIAVEKSEQLAFAF